MLCVHMCVVTLYINLYTKLYSVYVKLIGSWINIVSKVALHDSDRGRTFGGGLCIINAMLFYHIY